MHVGWGHVALAGAWGALVSLERRAFLQAMFSRPLVAATGAGLLLDDAASGIFAGLVFELFYLGAASVGVFVDVTVGVQVIIAAVLGGRRTILGAVLGAVFLIAMSEALRPIGDLANFVVFAMALVVVLLFPGGFFGLLTRTKEQG